MLLVASILTAAAGQAHAETRTLKLYFIHTKERADITYKRNGRYIQSGLNEVNRFLRDWRRNEPTKMDPKLMDVVWEAYQSVGARDYIHVVSAYRSPTTNSMLRSRSKGVAKNSQHTLGKAMDFYIPGVKLSTLRAAGLRLGAGGVGYYPTSGSPFVHFDVGSVRHWPRMSRKELVAIFPDGKTMHVPTDGKPLPGYNQALAAYKSRGRSGPAVQVASNTDDGATRSGSGSGRGLLAALFGGGADEEEENSSGFETIARATDRPVPAAAASRKPTPPAELPGVAVASAAPERTSAPARADPVQLEETPEQILAALPVRSVPLPVFASRPGAQLETVVASATGAVPAAEVSPGQDETVVALAVPRPTTRPVLENAAAPEPQLVASAEVADAAGQIRRSATETLAATVDAMPEQRPSVGNDAQIAEGQIGLAAFAPVPQLRPSGSDPIQELIAPVPANRPEVVASRGDIQSQIVGAVEQKLEKGARTAGAGSAASQRALLLASTGNVDPVAAVASEVKTTEKSAKPGPQDLKADRKPVVMPVEEVAARWALEHSGRLTRAIASAHQPSLAYNAILVSPRQVYTGGFAPGAQEPDPARFSGNAVTFIPVATFDTN